MNKEELEREIENYMHHIMWANNYYTAYNSTYDCIPDYYDEMIKASGFFTIARYALISNIIMEVCKLFDKREEKNMWALVSRCRDSQDCLSGVKYKALWEKERPVVDINQLLSLAEKKLSTFEKSVANLKGRRDKYYAHSDKEFFSQGRSLTEKYPVSDEEIRGLLDFAAGFCNSILGVISNKCIHPTFLGSDDLSNLLSLAHRAKSQTKKIQP